MTARSCIEASLFDFADHDVVALAKQLQALGGNFSEDAYREARPRKRLTLEDFRGNPKIASNAPDFVFEQIFERLDEL